MTSPWRKLPDGFNRCSPVGFVTMGAFIPRYFGARYARWMIFSCVGQNANTNDSGTTLREPGVGCTACKLGSRTFSRIGLWYQRLDDRSRMNREVHVRFWEGLAVRFHWATQLSRRRRIRQRFNLCFVLKCTATIQSDSHRLFRFLP